MVINKKLREVISTVIDSEGMGDELHAEYTKLRNELIFTSAVEDEKDKQLYKRFLEIIKNEDYFHINQVNALGIPWDVLIFMGKKGCGKSYWMTQAINNIVDNGGDVFLIRVLDADVRNGLRNQLNEEQSHVRLQGNSDFKLYHKTKVDEKGKPKHVGFASGMNTAAKYKGGGFPNLKAIFFDEITDDRKGKWTKEDVEIFFSHVANSLERNKDIPMILFGNVDQKSTSENPILSAIGVSSITNFKTITREVKGATKPTRILYINSRGMYKQGIQHSKFVGVTADAARQMQMRDNTKALLSSKCVPDDLIPFCSPLFLCVFPLGKDIISITVGCDNYGTEQDEDYWYVIKLEKFNPTYTADYRGNKYTDNSVIYNQYAGILEWRDSCADLWEELDYALLEGHVIICGGTEENLLFAKIMDERKSHYSRFENKLLIKNRMKTKK